MNELELKKELLSCPGDTIQETIDEIKMSQAELAKRLGKTPAKLTELIKGRVALTHDTAIRLENALGISAHFWNNLESEYQNELANIQRLEELSQQENWLKNFPIPELKKLKIVSNTKNKTQQITDLLRFFHVAGIKPFWEIYSKVTTAFKIDLIPKQQYGAIAVWLKLGDLLAENITLQDFRPELIKNRIADIQVLCAEQPNDWLIQLQNICADSGIALVYVPSIKGAPIYGATRWIKNRTIPLIQLSDRRKKYNSFWFSFYHELAHVLKHGKTEEFYEGVKGIKDNQKLEDEADEFAANKLLSKNERNKLLELPDITKELVLEFSNRYNKNPGIVMAQMQREKKIGYDVVWAKEMESKVEFPQIDYSEIIETN